MKLLVMSDCHANIDALQAVWAKEGDCDYILFAGDMVDFGLHPKETVQWFRQRKDKLFAVRGNHDEWILAHRDDPKPEGEPQNFQQLTFSQLTDEDYDFLAAIPHEITFTLGDTDFYMCHTTDELTQEIFYPEIQLGNLQMRSFFEERWQKKVSQSKATNRVIVYGHSHLQWAASAGKNCTILNPGSLSYRFGSFEEVRCADYIVIENGNMGLRHLDFDTRHLYRQGSSFADSEAARLARAFYREEGEAL